MGSRTAKTRWVNQNRCSHHVLLSDNIDPSQFKYLEYDELHIFLMQKEFITCYTTMPFVKSSGSVYIANFLLDIWHIQLCHLILEGWWLHVVVTCISHVEEWQILRLLFLDLVGSFSCHPNWLAYLTVSFSLRWYNLHLSFVPGIFTLSFWTPAVTNSNVTCDCNYLSKSSFSFFPV